ncbi:MAG TPA: Hpt domain-containing protein, partial [Terriglobales bacterium]
MSFFAEGGELRDLFFESASELLQSLNDGALALEKDPGNTEIVRDLRRTMHTLKGDSGACGYTELSELAHLLEDALTPEMVAQAPQNLADLVLEAADQFGEMLSAYRGGMTVPSGEALRQHISRRLSQPGDATALPSSLEGRFHWTEYEIFSAQQVGEGARVFNVALAVDPNCALPAAAIQMVRNALQQSGSLVAMHPEVAPASGTLDVIE